MPSDSKVYIAGVGYSALSQKGSSSNDPVKSQISAATKALLDAGLTYDYVTRGVRSAGSKGSGAFDALDKGAIDVDEAKDGSELASAFELIKSGKTKCVLAVATDKSGASAFVLVSDNVLWRHPYLKDAAILIQQSNDSQSKSGSQTDGALHDICKQVWQLRGWSDDKSKPKPIQSFSLTRADSQSPPKWKDVEHRQDGKYRLGYNPASETREVSHEDFEAVRGSGGKKKAKDEDKTVFKRKGGDRAALAKL